MNSLNLSALAVALLLTAGTPVVAASAAPPATPILRYDGAHVVVTPPPARGVVTNPGKGWVAYGSAASQPREVMDLVSLGYTLQDETALVSRLANRLGYHLVLVEARYPRTLIKGEANLMRLTWENRGVARMFVPASVAFALLNTEGKVVEVCATADTKPSEWKSDSPVAVADPIQFRQAPEGEYRLAVGLRRPADELQPFIKLGSEMETVDGCTYWAR